MVVSPNHFHAASRINAAPKPRCCTPINIANMVHMLLWTRHYIFLSAVCVQSEQRKNTFVQLTGKLQAGSPAEDRSDCIERHTLVQPRVLVAVQAAYNEVAPRQTPSAIQAQIYESPIQRPSVRAKTPSVPGNSHGSIHPSNQGGLTGVGNLCEVNSSEVRRIRCTFLLMWRRSSAHLRQPIVPGIGALMFFNIFSKGECSF